MKKKYYILTAIFSFVILLSVTVPAQLVLPFVKTKTNINIQGVSGTLWQGSAVVIQAKPNITLHNTKWSFNFWQLFLGKLSLSLNTKIMDNPINSDVGITFFGQFFAHNLQANFAAADIAKLANIPLAQFTGNVMVNLEHASWKQDETPLAEGTILWNKSSVTVAEKVSLGDIKVILSEENQHLSADISNRGGDIKISGLAQLLEKNQYKADIKLKATESAGPNINQTLSFIAKRQNDGSYQLTKSGSLNQLQLM